MREHDVGATVALRALQGLDDAALYLTELLAVSLVRVAATKMKKSF